MLFMLLGSLKNFYSIFTSFLSTKFGKIFICVLLVLFFIYCIWKYGYNCGIEEQLKRDKVVFDKAIAEQIKKSEVEKIKALEIKELNKKVEIIYKNKIIKVDKIIHDNPSIESKECSLSNNSLIEFNKILDEIK